jgi:hypothetical protein
MKAILELDLFGSHTLPTSRPLTLALLSPLTLKISINCLSRCCSSAAPSLPANSSCTLVVSASIFSGVQQKAFSCMSFVQLFVAGPRCSRRCLKPSVPPPPPMAFAMNGPTIAHLGPRLVVTQASASVDTLLAASNTIAMMWKVSYQVLAPKQYPETPDCTPRCRAPLAVDLPRSQEFPV